MDFNYQNISILYVDDEEKSLKYFYMAFKKYFNISIASSAEQAIEILNERGNSFGVLITDQRMPGTTGVQLLDEVRDGWPNIVRLLTTAYSDLEDAINAVNRGEIYRYITKPWDLKNLKTELNNAMELFCLRRDRNLLMSQKLNVWQHISLSNRVRDLSVITATSVTSMNAYQGVSSFFSQIINIDFHLLHSPNIDWGKKDFKHVVQEDTDWLISLANYLSNKNYPCTFQDSVNTSELIVTSLSKFQPEYSHDIELDDTNMKCDRKLIEDLFSILFDNEFLLFRSHINKIDIGQCLINKSNFCNINICFFYEHFNQNFSNDCHSIGRLLHVYFIIFHHNGTLEMKISGDNILTVDIYIPNEPSTITPLELSPNWIETIIENLSYQRDK